MNLIRQITFSLIVIFLAYEQGAHGIEEFQQRVVVNSSELCIIPITPTQLGWDKRPGSVKEIEYGARMANSPDLPEFLKYSYDQFTSTGYIYGVPPMRLVTLNLDVVGWHRYNNYDVRHLTISVDIMRKEPMEYIMEMKIDNLNIKDLCQPRKMNELKAILADHFGWVQKNGNRVVPVYMASAVDIGENRVPLRPNEAEGVVIHFASDKDFSSSLKRLQVEISPLWKLRPCPRDMKRTSVERHFRRYNFLVDWCSFRLQDKDGISGGSGGGDGKLGSGPSSTSASNLEDSTKDFVSGTGKFAIQPEIFLFTTTIPERSYGYEALLATIIPGSIGGLIGILLIAMLWVDREDESMDGDRLFFEAAFRMLYSLISYNNKNGGPDKWTYRQINQIHLEGSSGNGGGIIMSRNSLKTDMGMGTSVNPDGKAAESEIIRMPVPPQYSETHPNGTQARTYAV